MQDNRKKLNFHFFLLRKKNEAAVFGSFPAFTNAFFSSGVKCSSTGPLPYMQKAGLRKVYPLSPWTVQHSICAVESLKIILNTLKLSNNVLVKIPVFFPVSNFLKLFLQ